MGVKEELKQIVEPLQYLTKGQVATTVLVVLSVLSFVFI